VFKTDQLAFGVDLDDPEPINGQLAVRRVDLYWRIDNLTTYNLDNPWAPSITVTLFSPWFSTRRLSSQQVAAMIPQEVSERLCVCM
jgi:hypothetical protein